MAYPEPLEALVAAFEQFPGIGRRSAERLAFHVLREPKARALSQAIERAVEKTLRCAHCCNVSETDPCSICADPSRDARIVCVVEEPRHVEAIERSGAFHGRYHVLMGSLNPADGTEPEHLTVQRLLERVRREKPSEVILGTDPDAEGEATATLVLSLLEGLAQEGLVITRLARGLPAGSAIEYLHRGVLEDALGGRRPVRSRKTTRSGPEKPASADPGASAKHRESADPGASAEHRESADPSASAEHRESPGLAASAEHWQTADLGASAEKPARGDVGASAKKPASGELGAREERPASREPGASAEMPDRGDSVARAQKPQGGKPRGPAS